MDEHKLPEDDMEDIGNFPFLDDQEARNIDELIQSTKAELEHNEEILNGKKQSEQIAESMKSSNEEPFTPKLPVEYADLTLEEETSDEELPHASKRLSAGTRVFLYVISVLVVSAVLGIFGWVCADDVLALTKEDRVVTVTVDESDTVKTITEQLKEKGLINYPWLFRFYCWFSHAEDKIDPGTYELNNVYDYHALVNGMIATAQTRATKTVTIPEGYECRQIFELLEKEGVCSQQELEECAANFDFEYPFLEDLEYGESNRLEGYLFPDTYEFYVGDDPESVLRRFLRNYNNKFTDEMRTDIETLNTTLAEKMRENGFTEEEIAASMMDEHKIIIVASLIEKETAGSSESADIASVIYNRLCSKQYPLLQIDATIQYVLEERKEELSAEDLAISSPYNTYTNPGLPAGPIANPGLDSIRAALYPSDTSYYFYALDTDGKHHFSTTYYEHQTFLEDLQNAQE